MRIISAPLFKGLCFISLLSLSACATPGDSVSLARQQNQSELNESKQRSANLLIEMTNTAMMNFQQGELAMERGTTAQVREFGRQLMENQKTLLNEIQMVAKNENVTLPSKIGIANSDGLADLKKRSGKKFDDKFLSMIRADHEREIKSMRLAVEDSRNDYTPRVQTFAVRNLPVIEGQLARASNLESKLPRRASIITPPDRSRSN